MDVEREKFIILLLGCAGRPIPSFRHLQKELFVFSKTIPKVQEYFHFDRHYEGPYSQILQDLVREPIYFEQAFKISAGGISLTDYGRQVYNKILEEYKNDERFNYVLSALKLIREVYDKLSEDELLLLIYVSYPEYIEFSGVYERIVKDKHRRKHLADSLLRKGAVTPERYKELIEVSIN